jgi:magnesium chelatase subunit D
MKIQPQIHQPEGVATSVGWNAARPGFPLAGLVGQDQMKMALILLAVDPNIGGVLLVGQKGTAKSTAVRALAEILPPIDAIAGCPYHCDPDSVSDLCPECAKRMEQGKTLDIQSVPTPFLTLPLGATEDRVAGGLDLGRSLAAGRPILAPGLLGQANRGVLYVDEVNLLEPYLAHLLLDATETGRVTVEREGLSLWHPARAALIGTMNPEEGALGPQLADRFALMAPVSGEPDPALRTEIIRRRLAYEADPAGFRKKFSKATQDLKQKIVEARERLHSTGLSAKANDLIAILSRESRTAGHRADLALARASRALAAWENDSQAGERHVGIVADLALRARRRREKVKEKVQVVQADAPPEARHYQAPYIPPSTPEEPPEASMGDGDSDAPRVERMFEANTSFEITTPLSKRETGPRGRSGRRTARTTNEARGRYYRSSSQQLGRPLALDATFRAAAPYQKSRQSENTGRLDVRRQDFREKVFRKKTGRLIIFVVDASGSVGSLRRMSEAKAAALSLLSEAYQKRDRVALIAFHNTEARTLLPPTNSVDLASRLLSDMPTGGKTPFAAALVHTHRLLKTELARDPDLTPLVVIMTDGRPNVPLSPLMDPWREALQLSRQLADDARLRFLLVDTDRGHYADYKLTKDLAEALRAPRLTLEDLRHGRLEAWLEQVS